MTKCKNCGIEGDFCGYHNLGPDHVSLCVACGEYLIEVYYVTLEDNPKSGIVFKNIKEAMETIEGFLENMDVLDTSFIIGKKEITRLKLESLNEFEGF